MFTTDSRNALTTINPLLFSLVFSTGWAAATSTTWVVGTSKKRAKPLSPWHGLLTFCQGCTKMDWLGSVVVVVCMVSIVSFDCWAGREKSEKREKATPALNNRDTHSSLRPKAYTLSTSVCICICLCICVYEGKGTLLFSLLRNVCGTNTKKERAIITKRTWVEGIE